METVNEIALSEKHLKMMREMLKEFLGGKEVWAFGSRVRGSSTSKSDLDLVVFGGSEAEVIDMKEAFDNSDIPPRIEIMRWEDIPSEFQQTIKEKYIVLQS